MAIFVAFAWVIEAAAWLGLIDVECPKSSSRAYRLAHEGLALLKSELGGRSLEVLDEHTVAVNGPGGRTLLQCRDGNLVRCGEEESEILLYLGPGGEVNFHSQDRHNLEIRVSAHTDDGGTHHLCLSVPRQGKSLKERAL